MILWKSIYKHKETFYVDAIRTVQSSTWCLGETIRVFDYKYHLPDLEKGSQQKKDIERFRWFSQDYLGYDKEKNIVTDVRYSMIPNKIAPMWGLTIDEQRGINEHATWWSSRNLDQRQLDMFIDMLKGKSAITDKQHYNLYNLSIILSWLLHPTKAYGCKSLIARHHCCNKNRVFRLYKLYNTNDKFRSFVDKAKDNYTNTYA